MKTVSNCIVCNKPLSGKQRSFCSIECKNDHFLSYDALKKRANERKTRLIDLKGRRCNKCGYSTNLDALSFYDLQGATLHIDTNILANSNYEKLVKRLNGCQVLCRNCVEEVQNPERMGSWLTTRNDRGGEIAPTVTPRNDVGISEKFEKNIATIGLPSDQTIVLGVSGGVDSVVMLDLFANHPDFTRSSLVIAHVNHGFRAEADEDEKFVKSLANKYGIKFVSKKLTPHIKHSHILQNMRMSNNLEEYFRDERRKFLLDTVRLQGATLLALAHNADDQAETVIMNVARGSGPGGLSGMKSSDGRLIRPLLHFSRAEIVNYAAANKLKWHEDETNKDISYSRNYIRHQILPLLSRLNPEYLANIGRSSEIQREIDDYLKTRAGFLTRQLHENSLVSKDIPKPVLYEAFGLMFKQVRGNRKDLSLSHLAAIEKLVDGASGAKELELPGGVVARRQYNHLDFVLKMRDNIASVKSLEKLAVGQYLFGDWKIVIEPFFALSSRPSKTSGEIPQEIRRGSSSKVGMTKEIIENDKNSITVDTLDDLQIRTAKPGDRIRKHGMDGRKKLQDLFVDAKIDRIKRQNYPILTSKSTVEVLWVPGLAISKLLATHKAKYNITISKG